MKRSTLALLIVASALVIAGSVIFALAMTMANWNFASLDTSKYSQNIHVIKEDFNNISINVKSADIIFIRSQDEKASVISYEKEKLQSAVSVDGDTLVIKTVDTRKWYDYISIGGFKTPKITVHLPKSAYDSLLIKSSTGDIELPDDFYFEKAEISASTGDIDFLSSGGAIKIKLSTGDAEITNINADSIDVTTSTGEIVLSDIVCTGDIKTKVSTGKTKLYSVKCENFSSIGDTGDLSLTDTLASKSLSVKRDTGDVKFEKCDAMEIKIETDTGDIKGSLLSDKIFTAKSDTGSVHHPDSVPGCISTFNAKTDTGDIRITVE